MHGVPHLRPAHLFPCGPPHLTKLTSPTHPQIVSVDEHGLGIKRIRPKSLLDMLKVRLIRHPGWRLVWCAAGCSAYGAACMTCTRLLSFN